MAHLLAIYGWTCPVFGIKQNCLDLLFQAAAGSDVGNLPESTLPRSAIDLTAPASDQPFKPPSTAGDALLAAQLQEEDQVATQTICDLRTKHRTEQQKLRSANFVAPHHACTVCIAPLVPGIIIISIHA